MSLDSEPDNKTYSERILDRLHGEGPYLNVLAARPPEGATLEKELARQLARLANGEAVLQALAADYLGRIRYRMPHAGPKEGQDDPALLAQVLSAAVQFFERVEARRADLARQGSTTSSRA